MSVKVRVDSMYKFASPYFDESQDEYVWGIADPPEPKKREDDQYYTLRKEDKITVIAHKMLGSSRYWWVVLLYNNMPDALETGNFIGKQLRLPSRATLEKEYGSAFEQSTNS